MRYSHRRPAQGGCKPEGRMAISKAAGQPPQEYEFEAMNLQVGGRLQLITHRQIKPVEYFSTLIGYVKDEYLIV
jgi:hypothetical protein